jgi:glycosyltransferase involved in cell wall biosynthesis
MNPVLSLIIPVYKTELYLAECLNSILKQDIRGVEIILVDDGSPDECPKICDRYAAEHSFIQVIHKENGGLSSARNSGLLVAKGKYVWFIDSDDYLLPTALSNVKKTLINNRNAEVFSSGLMRYYMDSQSCVPEKIPYGKLYGKRGEYLWDKCPQGATPRFICRRDFLLKNNLYFRVGLLHEDGEWGFRTLYLAQSIKILDEPIYVYRVRTSDSIMSSITIKSASDLVEGHKLLISFMETHVLKEDRKKYLLSIWTMLKMINIFCYPLFYTKEFNDFLTSNYSYIRHQALRLIKSDPLRIKSYFYLLHPYSQMKLLRIIGKCK